MPVDIRDATVECPLIAIKTIRGEPLRIFLTMKYYILLGGEKIVHIQKLSETLEIEESLVKIFLAELKMEGLIINKIDHFSSFADDQKINTTPMVLNEYAKKIDFTEQGFQDFLKSITEADCKVFFKENNTNLLSQFAFLQKKAKQLIIN